MASVPASVTDALDAATARAGVEIRVLETARELEDLRRVCDEVWPAEGTNVTPNLLRASVHAGGYAAAAYREGRPVGAAMGVVGRHRAEGGWEEHLHSHMNAVLDGHRDAGIGTALKLHQRAWAAEHDFPWIAWTFDPLVRRNAHMNVRLLGAQVRGYEPDFYGAMADGINAGDPTDRMFAWWDVQAAEPQPAIEPVDGDLVIPVPADIVAIRGSDAIEARGWRLRVRQAMTRALADGAVVVGVDLATSYVLRRQP